LSAIRLKDANSSTDGYNMTIFSRRRAPKPRPQLVAWTEHYRVENGRTVARDAWVQFPGADAPRLVPVAVAA
jgi:hypothetical protein